MTWVLVIDGNATSRSGVTFALAEQGYGVLSAPDEAAALVFAKHHHPDVLVLDSEATLPASCSPALRFGRLVAPAPEPQIIVLAKPPDAEARRHTATATTRPPKPFNLSDLVDLVVRHGRR